MEFHQETLIGLKERFVFRVAIIFSFIRLMIAKTCFDRCTLQFTMCEIVLFFPGISKSSFSSSRLSVVSYSSSETKLTALLMAV